MDEIAFCEYCGEMCNPTHHECGGNPEIITFEPPDLKWQIEVGGKRGVAVAMETKPPNRFQRFMYKILLGWNIRIL